jgi:hypothetical protein
MWATGHLKRRDRAVWQILFCLTLLSFLFRSAIPVGYMPSTAGKHHQRLTIALCTMGGGSEVQLSDLFSQAPHPSGHDGAHQACPFCAVVSQAIAPGSGALALVPTAAARFIVQVPGVQAQATVAVAGPPLGPRAPPTFLG